MTAVVSLALLLGAVASARQASIPPDCAGRFSESGVVTMRSLKLDSKSSVLVCHFRETTEAPVSQLVVLLKVGEKVDVVGKKGFVLTEEKPWHPAADYYVSDMPAARLGRNKDGVYWVLQHAHDQESEVGYHQLITSIYLLGKEGSRIISRFEGSRGGDAGDYWDRTYTAAFKNGAVWVDEKFEQTSSPMDVGAYLIENSEAKYRFNGQTSVLVSSSARYQFEGADEKRHDYIFAHEICDTASLHSCKPIKPVKVGVIGIVTVTHMATEDLAYYDIFYRVRFADDAAREALAKSLFLTEDSRP